MKLIFFCLLLVASSAWAQKTAGAAPKSSTKQESPFFRLASSLGAPSHEFSPAKDADFRAAQDAYRAGDAAKLERLARRLQNTPLEVYVSYYQLRLNLETADPGVVIAFLSRAEDTPMIDRLRGEWLKLLGKKQQWELFDAEYPRLIKEDAELVCYELQSRHLSRGEAVLSKARDLWFDGKDLPESCDALFDAALSAHVIGEQDVLRRLRLALEAGNVSLAKKLAGSLRGDYAELPAALQSASADTVRYLDFLAQYKPDAVSNVRLARAAAGESTDETGLSFFPGTPFSDTPKNDSLVADIGSSLEARQALRDGQAVVDSVVLQRKSGWSDSQRISAIFALQRLAKQSVGLAAARWAGLSANFTPDEQRYFYGWLAYEAARDLDGRALQWYKAAENTPLNEQQLAWRVRAALRAQDWPEVQAGINAMSAKQQRESAWQYWKARAFQELGKPVEARNLFALLSGEVSFYGQLAGDELADTPVLSETLVTYKPDQQAIDAMLEVHGIQRTLALYRMGLQSDALEEWRWVLRNFNDRELLTAAEIARRNKMYDRAIGAADRTVNVHDFSMRYLAPYRDAMKTHIRNQGLEEAWVYGLMRQESRFVSGAKSDVGAAGLMQIMPATARWVAAKLGLKSYRNKLIHQVDTNMRLGTYYMKTVLAQFGGNPVLASAAYNAGPGRARDWCASQPLEGAIYTETIPFEETRDYVKKVMSNTVYYARQFNAPQRTLKQRLGSVPAKPADS